MPIETTFALGTSLLLRQPRHYGAFDAICNSSCYTFLSESAWPSLAGAKRQCEWAGAGSATCSVGRSVDYVHQCGHQPDCPYDDWRRWNLHSSTACARPLSGEGECQWIHP